MYNCTLVPKESAFFNMQEDKQQIALIVCSWYSNWKRAAQDLMQVMMMHGYLT